MVSEAQEQINLFQWIGWMGGREPRLALAFHVPNGEKRSKGVAGRLKAMGVRRGVPDILFPCPSRGFVGLALEMKAKGGSLSPEQKNWIAYLETAYWYTCVAYNWVEAAKALCWYLERDDLGFSEPA